MDHLQKSNKHQHSTVVVYGLKKKVEKKTMIGWGIKRTAVKVFDLTPSLSAKMITVAGKK